ncbi:MULTISPECIES: type II secretion system F family protein [unclassified Microbacterium]|uniref:type II secretion system F family protein n=1 Tax=unclassified Microbacterium TaxID=2609290 RepID=UPI0012FB1892|nr:type II secretion system F family protein [Microbacterium sp. MAH-37]MVQ43716.1 type II secretion system protein F [Microbacterium sp. MAH-37]
MNPALLLGGILLGMLALFALLFLVIAPAPPRVARSRRLAPGQEHVSALSRLTQRTTDALDAAGAKRRKRLFGAEELELAGIKTEPSGFLILVTAGSAVLAVLGALLGLSSGLSLLLAILFAVLGPVIAKLIVSSRTSARQAKFGEQIDDVVQMIAGSLRAGHGLNRAIAAVAAEAEEPASEELTRVVNETRLGRPLADALRTVAERMKSPDFEWVTQAIAISQETGGNLAEVLDQVGATIRERGQIRRQVRALSAEGRLSAVILVLLPIGLFAFVALARPEYIGVFFTNPIGIIAIIVAAILLVVGTIWASYAVKVEF